MNILIICKNATGGVAHSKVSEGDIDIPYVDSVETGEARTSFMAYKSGPRYKVEAMAWDIIAITGEAAEAIGAEDLKAEWIPPCISMAGVLIIDNKVIAK